MNKIIFSFFFIISINSIFSQIEILNENFQLGMPLNWEIINNNPYPPVDLEYSNGWIVIEDPENINDSVISSTSYFSPVGVSNDWLITPHLTLGSFGNFISWKAKSHDASFPDDYLILLSTTGKLVSDFTDTIGYIQQENFEWTSRNTGLNNATYLGQDVYLAFVNITNNGFKLYMDSIIVTKNDPVSLSEIKHVGISIYPNPVGDQLHIQSPYDISLVTIRNISGQITIQERNKNINVSSLNSGYYTIEIISNGYTTIQRFLKAN